MIGKLINRPSTFRQAQGAQGPILILQSVVEHTNMVKLSKLLVELSKSVAELVEARILKVSPTPPTSQKSKLLFSLYSTFEFVFPDKTQDQFC